MARHSPADIPQTGLLSSGLNQTGDKLMDGNYLNDPEGKTVPENPSGYPFGRIYDTILPSFGFFVRHVDNITFDGVMLETAAEDKRVPFVLSDVSNAGFNKVLVKKGQETAEWK